MKLSNIWNGNGRRLKLSTGQMSDVKTRENVNDYDMWACLAPSAYKQRYFVILFLCCLCLCKYLHLFIIGTLSSSPPIILGD